MSVYQRSLIKQQQNFYRDYFRRFVVASIGSMIISFLLLLAIFYVYLTQAPVTFYASNTAGFITPLPALSQPNQTDNYLLPPDPPVETTVKTLNLEQ